MENIQSLDLATSLLIGLIIGMLAGGVGITAKALLAWKGVPRTPALVLGIAIAVLSGVGAVYTAKNHTAAMVVSSGAMGALVTLASTAKVLRDEPEG